MAMILTAAIAALPLYGCGAADTAPANNGEVEEVRADEAAAEDRGEDSGERDYSSRRDDRRYNRRDRDTEARRSPEQDRRFFSGQAEPDENRIEGRNAVIEAYRAGRTIEKLYQLEGPAEGAMQTVLRLARDHHTPVRFLTRQRLDQLSQTGRHQGVIA